VPEQALVPQGDDQFVFKVVDGRAQRAKVDIGQPPRGQGGNLRGLVPADMVVTAGHLKIRDARSCAWLVPHRRPPRKWPMQNKRDNERRSGQTGRCPASKSNQRRPWSL